MAAPHAIPTTTLIKVIRGEDVIAAAGRLFVSVDNVYLAGVPHQDVGHMLARAQRGPAHSRPVACARRDDGSHFIVTARSRLDRQSYITADTVRFAFPNLQVGDLERGVYKLSGSNQVWVQTTSARVALPEMFPGDKTKLRASDIKHAAFSDALGWTACAVTAPGAVSFVRKDLITERQELKRSGLADPRGDIRFTLAELLLILGVSKEDAKGVRMRVHLRTALDQSLITKREYNASMPQAMRTEKCYLYSQVIDPRAREALDALVLLGSEMLLAGSILLNLVAIRNPQMTLTQLTDQTFAKYLVFPWKGGAIPPEIAATLRAHDELWKLWPSKDEVDSILDNIALDNFLQQQGTKLSASSKVHVQAEVEDRVKAHILLLCEGEGCTVRKQTVLTPAGLSIRRTSLWEWLLDGAARPAGLSDNLAASISDFTCLWSGGKLKNLKYDEMYRLHQRVVITARKARSMLPVFGLNRLHVRLDSRVTKGLCQKAGLDFVDLDTFLDISGMRERRRVVRLKIRRKDKRARGARCGFGSVSESIKDANIRVTSFETDGVGLSICYSWNEEAALEEARKLPVLGAKDIGSFDPKKTASAAVDPGRAQPITDAVCDPEKPESFTSHRITRAQYYRASLFDRRRIAEEDFMTGNERLRGCYQEMAQLTWKTVDEGRFMEMVNLVIAQLPTHKEERRSKRQALWNMVLWRRKMSYKDQRANEMIKRWMESKPGATHLVVFYGNGGFAPTGRGERSVPTKEWIVRLLHAMKRRGISGGILMTGEYLTTQMCHKCHALTSEGNEDGTVNRDRRCCRGTCATGSPNNCRALNRDRNAAINIYKAGWAYIMGEARPVWLTKAWKDECLKAADHQPE